MKSEVTHQKNSSPSEVTHKKQQFLDFLRFEYPDYHFHLKSRFSFRYPKMINLDQSALLDDTPFSDFALQTLHELGHALNEHQNYATSVDRLKLESEAWQTAKALIEKHQHFENIEYLNYNPEYAETHLDTYRDWLHAQSLCKKCTLTRFQDDHGRWHCPHCDHIF